MPGLSAADRMDAGVQTGASLAAAEQQAAAEAAAGSPEAAAEGGDDALAGYDAGAR